MALQEIKPDIYYVGAIDWDRRLFDELIPLPEGTSYNSYLIKGSEKVALLDTVDPTKEAELIDNLAKAKVKKIDYLIAHHAEQDHSGTIPTILSHYPEAKIITNQKGKNFLQDLLLVPDNKFILINDGDTLSLGHKTLQFIMTPWVHWPETMVTYLKEDNILFSCDFFGSHLASSHLFVTDEAQVYESAKRYYAEIMMPFRTNIKKNLAKIEALKIALIAPSHGPLYLRPEFIIEAYGDWTSDEVKNEVIIPYISMHGSTEKMVSYFIEKLMVKGLTVKPFNLAVTDIGQLAMALVDAASIVIGTPTVLTGPHPLVLYATYLANALRPKLKFASIIGSYGWGGRTVDIISSLLTNIKAEILEPVLIKGYPKPQDFQALTRLAEKLVTRHKNLGITNHTGGLS